MANRDNHYEAAFEAYLRCRGVPYVAVDEARRTLMADGRSIKSLDFIVSAPVAVSWLVDVKGRRFPSGSEDRGNPQYWKNWSTRDDLWSLARWEQLFGDAFRGLLVFAYDVLGARAPVAADRLFQFRDNLYGFVGVPLADYASHARPISTAWDTVAMGARDFRRLARPMEHWLTAAAGAMPARAESLDLDRLFPEGAQFHGAVEGWTPDDDF
ncbi:MAG: HYExAFE family protein [Planctomycetota bacterium]